MTGYELFLAIWFAVAVAISAAFAAIVAVQARTKGRRPWLWAILGLLFGIFAVIALSRMARISAPGR